MKKKATPEQVAQVNQWNKEKKARHRLRKYFKVNDYLITLTYPKDRRPKDMEQAKADFREVSWLPGRNTRKGAWSCAGTGIFQCTPTGNWHIHVALNLDPDTDIIIEAAWKHGRVKDKQLLYREGNFKKLAQYLTKDAKSQEKYVEKGVLDHKVVEANYSVSRNMPLPEPEKEKLDRWPKEPEAPRGWYIDKESYFEGRNKVTGFPYRHYTLFRIQTGGKRE